MLFSMVFIALQAGGAAEAAQSVLCEQEGGRAAPGSSDLRMPTGTRQKLVKDRTFIYLLGHLLSVLD